MSSSNFFTKSTLGSVIFLAVVIGGAYYIQSRKDTVPTEPQAEVSGPSVPFTISEEDLEEENFSGTVARIGGDSPIALASRSYIDGILSEFKKSADTDVPAMRKEFGPDSPSANYSMDVTASRVESADTESAVIGIYTYTGGAHGSSSYKVFTASKSNGELLALSDIVKADQKEEFTSYVKNKLNKWGPGGEGSVVFPEEVEDLEFGSFVNWALDGKSLILYFSQYEIGPGVLGAVAFPLSLEELKDYLI